MATGKIKKIIRGQFGFIEQDDGGKDVYFRLNLVEGAPSGGPYTGMAVEYETRATDRGLQTRWVRAVDAPRAKDRQAARRHSDEYLFLNPYNFVRPLTMVEDSDTPLLGRCPPPPHDRYVGLTGRLTCELTATTPLFTADSEWSEEEDKHKTLRFFQYDGRPAIPGSSLRGAIRSVFEAATNSCFAVFNGYRRLSYHLDATKAPQLVPGRVERDEESGEWQLRLLIGTTPLQVGRIPNGPQYAAWLHRFWPMQPSGTLQNPPSNQRVREFKQRRRKDSEVFLHGLEHGDKCYALIEEVQHPFPQIQFWDVRAVNKERKSLDARRRGQQRIVEGYLCLNNQNIEPKHSERFFFRDPDNKYGEDTVALSKRVRRDYEELIAEYQERHSKKVEKRREKKRPLAQPLDKKTAGLSRFVYMREARTLQEGDLVYAFLEGKARAPRVKFIVPVTVPRVGYRHRVEDLLDPQLHKCQEYDQLCPACRIFGWVWSNDNPEEEKPSVLKHTAYAGRVRFEHARIDHDAGTFDTTLAILSTPKPTAVRFYLMDKDGRTQDGLNDDEVNYDTKGQILRGRKFYHHHGEQLSKQEYERAGTLKGIQEPGSRFIFEIQFENLAPVELGALLWALEMEGWHHRLGMGKPLGFGSATLRVTGLETLDMQARYQEDGPGWQQALEEKESYITLFKQAMTSRYGRSFEALDNIEDLESMLAASPDLPVHYPRTSRTPQEEGKNFEWFMGNKRSGRNAGPRLTLRPPSEEGQGLPLLDKSGKVVK